MEEGRARGVAGAVGNLQTSCTVSGAPDVEVPSCNLRVGPCLAPTSMVLHRPFSGLHFLTCNRRKLGSISPWGCMKSKRLLRIRHCQYREF